MTTCCCNASGGEKKTRDTDEGDVPGREAGRALAREVGNAFGSAFEDSLIRDKPFKKVFNSLIRDLQSTLLQGVVETSFNALLSRGTIGSGIAEGLTGLIKAFTFADGGVMGPAGPLPVQGYARGGVADSPQLALFGEGRTPEAFVPLPDGRRIPVRMEGAAGAGRAVSVVNHITVNAADAGSFRRAEGQIGAEIAGRLQRHLSRNG